MADDTSINQSQKETGVREKFECELCLESFNLYDRKPVSLVPCVGADILKFLPDLQK
jgi:hypothetical protein